MSFREYVQHGRLMRSGVLPTAGTAAEVMRVTSLEDADAHLQQVLVWIASCC